MENVPIEDRSIPGVTAKSLAWFFGGVISVIISVMWSAFSIKSDVKDGNTKIENLAAEVQNVKEAVKTGETDRKTMSLQIQALQLQVTRLEAQMNERKNP